MGANGGRLVGISLGRVPPAASGPPEATSNEQLELLARRSFWAGQWLLAANL